MERYDDADSRYEDGENPTTIFGSGILPPGATSRSFPYIFNKWLPGHTLHDYLAQSVPPEQL